MTTTKTIGVESSTNDDDDDDTVFDVLRLNAENVSESDELNNLAITERRTRAAEDERRKRLKAEIKDIENHLRVENSKENERRSRGRGRDREARGRDRAQSEGRSEESKGGFEVRIRVRERTREIGENGTSEEKRGRVEDGRVERENWKIGEE